MSNKPFVSICCVTYNHKEFIRQCLDGFLMQEGVDYEILIHDDCSTDGTTEIVKEYAAQYPDKIFPLYEEVNQYQNGKAGEMDFFNYKRARGKYIAYCEGDDYWTDPLKLKKQVEFMETHEEYSICFHQTLIYEVGTNETWTPPTIEDFDMTAESCAGKGVGQPLSMLFRKDKLNLEWYKHFTYYNDAVENYLLIREGKGRMMNFIGGVYNLQSGGTCFSKPQAQLAYQTVVANVELYAYTRDRWLKPAIEKTSLWALGICFKERKWDKVKSILKKIFTIDSLLAIKIVLIAIKREIKESIKP